MLLIATGAFVSIWSGWVGLGELTGFGPVVLLPGIADRWVINSAITLPLGVEAYAAFALFAWLTDRPVTPRARTFARYSALGALTLGALGQVAYHLMDAAGYDRAPWGITAFVSCLPVVVLGCGAALAHLLSNRTAAAFAVRDPQVDPLDEPGELPTPEELRDPDPHGWWPLHVVEAPADSSPEPVADSSPEPDYRDTALPLEQRIDLAIAAELAAGAPRPPGRRRLAELLGLPDPYPVRAVLEARARDDERGENAS